MQTRKVELNSLGVVTYSYFALMPHYVMVLFVKLESFYTIVVITLQHSERHLRIYGFIVFTANSQGNLSIIQEFHLSLGLCTCQEEDAIKLQRHLHIILVRQGCQCYFHFAIFCRTFNLERWYVRIDIGQF